MVLKEQYCAEYPYEDVLKWIRITGDGGPVYKPGKTEKRRFKKIFLFNDDELLSFPSVGTAADFCQVDWNTFQSWWKRNAETKTTPVYYVKKEEE